MIAGDAIALAERACASERRSRIWINVEEEKGHPKGLGLLQHMRHECIRMWG